MSFIYGGAACNMSSYISLSSNNSASAGSAVLSNNDINTYGFVTRFTGTGMSNNGTLDYSWDKWRLSFNSLSNNVYLFYSSNLLTFNPVAFQPSNLVCVKYSASSNNTTVKAYLNDVTSLSYSTGNTYTLSNGVHGWVSSNSTATEKRLYAPLIQNVTTLTNSVDIQQSLRVSGKLTCLNMAVSNLTVQNLSVVQSTSNLTAGTITSSNLTTSGPIYSSNSVSSPYIIATDRVYTPTLEWTGGPMNFYSSNFNVSTNATTNAFNITNAGNIGMGTTAPASRLDVNGVMTSWGLQLHSSAVINTGYDVSKEANAGKIGYQTFSSALDIVGAGTASGYRTVRIFDRLGINVDAGAQALTVGGKAFISGNIETTTGGVYSLDMTASSAVYTPSLVLGGATTLTASTISHGAFTPSYSAAAGSFNATHQSAAYTRLGGMVTVTGAVLISPTSTYAAPTRIYVTGLPYAVNIANVSSGIVSGTVTSEYQGLYTTMVYPSNSSTISLYINRVGVVGTNFYVHYSFQYLA